MIREESALRRAVAPHGIPAVEPRADRALGRLGKPLKPAPDQGDAGQRPLDLAIAERPQRVAPHAFLRGRRELRRGDVRNVDSHECRVVGDATLP